MNFPKLWIAGLSAAVFAVSGTYLWREGIPSSVMKPAANTPPARPVPVTAGVVKDQDFAISRVGLGTVQAYNTVTVKVRVDGEVQKIAFREGQDVRVGDVMAQIDPRPYQAQLHQAEADKAHDEALLANTKLILSVTASSWSRSTPLARASILRKRWPRSIKPRPRMIWR